MSLNVGILGASGGVGASCLAAAVATRAALAGESVALVDGSTNEGRLDALFDLDTHPGARWPDLAAAQGSIDGRALLPLLPRSTGGVWILASAPPAAARGQVPVAVVGETLAALGAATDRLIIDLPRLDSPHLPAMARCCDHVVLLVGTSLPALAKAEPAAEALAWVLETAEGGGSRRGLWVAQRGPRSRSELAESVAAGLGQPLLAVVPDDPRLDANLVRGLCPGEARGRLADVADRILASLAAQARAA